MKRSKICKLLYIAALLLALSFAVTFGIDAYRYSDYFGSAPLYVYAIIRAVEFVLPGIIAFVIGIIISRKSNKD